MDGADATAAPPLGAWASIQGYFTPATLFLVVNLVIGTIALTSRSHQRRRRGYHQDDAHHQEPLHQLHQQEYHYYQQPQPQQQYAPPPAPLARTSSVLDRLRSLGLYRFRSGDFPPEYTAAASHAQDVISPVDDEAKQTHYARNRSEPSVALEEKRAASRMKKSSSEVRKAEVARALPAVVQAAVEEEDVVDARADEFIDNLAPQQQELHYQEQYVPPPAPAPLARAPSVLERLRSFGLYRFRSGDLAPEYAAPTPPPDATTAAADKKKQAAHYDRSQSEPVREQNKEKKQAAAEARMTKSSSEARKAAPSIVEEEGVDARADDFINKFRQQLQLQRLNSLLNYKEMLNRGGKQ